MPKEKLDLERIKNLQNLDFSSPGVKEEVLNHIEILYGTIIEMQKVIQKLNDEINRLKGEKGKPDFKKKKDKADKTDKTDSQKEIFEVAPKKPWEKSTKSEKIKINRQEIIQLDKTNLPDDIINKGYEHKLVQNIIFKTDNVLYLLEKYYSPSENKTYIAKADESIQGTEFGPETKALISCLYYENRVTENKIASFLNSNGLHISEGTISNILIKDRSSELTEVKNEIIEAGVSSSSYQQIDDTGMKIAGKSGYATILCNEKFSAFFINFSKSRETVMNFLTAYLVSLFIVLVGDDAPQFKKIAKRYALCWVHEERHYKKLNPLYEQHRDELTRVQGEIWEYYKELKKYKLHPTEEKKERLSHKFDKLFGQKTCYEELNIRLALTLNKKGDLLTVLDYPEVPLHNNLSESGIREIVIKRKISGGVETEEGLRAWENNMSILATCKKLGVSFYDYMRGVFSKKPYVDLPELIHGF